MRTKILFTTLLVGAMALSGCAKGDQNAIEEEPTPQPQENYVTITAGFEQGDDKTKTLYDSTTGLVEWARTDEIGLICYYGDLEDENLIADNLQYKTATGGRTTDFTGNFKYLTPAMESSYGEEGLDYNFYIYYPYDKEYEIYEPGIVPFGVPGNQSYNPTTNIMSIRGRDAMVTSITQKRGLPINVDFKRIPVIIELRLKNQLGKTVTVEHVELMGDYITMGGSFEYDFNEDEAWANSTNNYVSVTVTEGQVRAGAELKVRFMIYPDPYAPDDDEDITLTVELTDEESFETTMKLYRSNGEPFERGGYYYKTILMQ